MSRNVSMSKQRAMAAGPLMLMIVMMGVCGSGCGNRQAANQAAAKNAFHGTAPTPAAAKYDQQAVADAHAREAAGRAAFFAKLSAKGGPGVPPPNIK